LLTALGPALEKLEQLTPALKRGTFDACVRAVLFDRQVRDDELTLLSAVGEALGCPLPAVIADEGRFWRKPETSPLPARPRRR
jgi:hypothetical protein